MSLLPRRRNEGSASAAAPGLVFADRREAGRELAARLRHLAGREDLVVLGLPRGGVPVAAEVAGALGAPLDVFVVRKLGVPGQEELAFGAVASGGARVLNDSVVWATGIPESEIEAITARARGEVAEQERTFRQGMEPLPLAARTAIVVDDGLATGATMRVALDALREAHPAAIVTAVPVAPAEVCRWLSQQADEVVCISSPEPFTAVGLWYGDFAPVDDEEVRRLLRAHRTGRVHPHQEATEMPQTVREVMTQKPVALQAGTTLAEAAQAMRDHDIGDVVVLENDTVRGIVTDRDIAVRAVAEGRDPASSVLAEICSQRVVTISPGEPVERAITLMRQHAVRRLPVVEDGRPVGIVSLGDLAVDRDPESLLGQISAADPNR